jgi:predicted nucleic acid-binding protein
MPRAYTDADVVIEHLRGRRRAIDRLRTLVATGNDLWMAAMQRTEILFYLLPGEADATFALLRRINTQPLTESMVDLGAEYYRRWHPSHGIGKNDALLAATVAITGGRIITQNIRHFPMPEIEVEQGWSTT